MTKTKKAGAVFSAFIATMMAMGGQAMACDDQPPQPTGKIGVSANGSLSLTVGRQVLRKGEDGVYAVRSTVRCIDPEWEKHLAETLAAAKDLCSPGVNANVVASPSAENLSDQQLALKIEDFCDGVNAKHPDVPKGTKGLVMSGPPNN